MPAHKLARTLSARALAEVLAAGVEIPDDGQAITARSISEEAGVQVVVMVARWAKPQLHLFPVAEQQLREIEKTTLEACPESPPITLKRLASLSGYSYNQYFRNAVDSLVNRGLLGRNKKGVYRLKH